MGTKIVLGMAEVHMHHAVESQVIKLFCDARGSPARLAAVIFVNDQILFTDFAPPSSLLEMSRSRNDDQIMGLEMLASALGLSTFEDHIKGKNVCLWSDNVGGECASRRGSAKNFDNNCIVHCLWLYAARPKLGLQVERVSSELNISDLPSREEYSFLFELGAAWVKPHLANAFWDPCSWNSLSLKG